ncbi:hypothetical protein ACH5RR_014260 [Cinchona calisaya]|uniref:UDP-glycosyltransferase n=1 Tax=Cinchona calisaya TaxID=153742 RepID=A0ABD3A875_9GENT
MSGSKCLSSECPHIAFIPSGMGNLAPFFQLASKLAAHNSNVTFFILQPQPSSSGSYISSFFSKHPQIKRFDFEIHHENPSSSMTKDPFMTRIEAINNSLHHLGRIIPSFDPPQLSAIFSDFVIAATLTQIAADLSIPLYIVSTTSAKFYSLVAYLPVLISKNPDIFRDHHGDIEIPGLSPAAKTSIPPTWLHDSPSNYLLTEYLLPNAKSLPKVNGVFLNSFNWFEPETIAALSSGRVSSDLPPVFPVGPLEIYSLEKGHHFPWLDDQSSESVIYVDFVRGALKTCQMKELAKGLEMSGYPFLWVLHENDEPGDFLGDSFLNGLKNQGKTIKGSVSQAEILAHPATGGFVNQCDWDSVMAAAREGVPILAWPHHGDQKMNAEVVDKAGLGIWVKDWGWAGQRLVKAEEIGEMLRQMMTDLNLRCTAKKVKEEAWKACEVWGSLDVLNGIIKS